MIQIYGNAICLYCKKAKKLAEKHSLDYVYKDVDEDKYMEEFKTNFPGVKKLPQIVWHGKHIGGYDQFAIEIENTLSDYGQGGF